MTDEAYYKNKVSFGGFSPDNIRQWIIKECMESGNPMSFFWVIRDVVGDLEFDGYFELLESQ